MPRTESLKSSSREKSMFSGERVDVSLDLPSADAEFLSHKTTTIDAGTAPSLPSGTIEISGIRQDLIGSIMVGESAIGIVRVLKGNQGQVVLTKMDPGAEKFTYLEMISPEEQVVLGRDKINPDDREISKDHLVIRMNEYGVLSIHDNSTNGSIFIREKITKTGTYNSGLRGLKKVINKKRAVETIDVDLLPFIENPKSWSLTGPISKLVFEEEHKKSGQANWDYTFMPSQQKRLGVYIRGYEEPYIDQAGKEVPATYQGRRVISRESPVNGGVYIVPGSQEAIVVDDGTRPKEGDSPREINPFYQHAFNDFIDLAKSYGVSVRQGVKQNQVNDMLGALLESVGETIHYDVEFSEYVGNNYKDRKINLHEFIAEGAGVCRHQALLAGYILERLINGGFLSGKVSVDRNYVKDQGGHALARFTDDKGNVYIIDPANWYAGRLDKNSNKIWSYSRPEDQI